MYICIYKIKVPIVGSISKSINDNEIERKLLSKGYLISVLQDSGDKVCWKPTQDSYCYNILDFNEKVIKDLVHSGFIEKLVLE